MSEEQDKKQSKALKEVPWWVGLLVSIVFVGIVGAAFFSTMFGQSTPSTTADETFTKEKSYDTIPDVCTDNATLKASNKVKSVGSVTSFLDAKHDQISSNKMIHRWNGEYADGRKAQFSCYTTIKPDGSESIDELWLDLERLL